MCIAGCTDPKRSAIAAFKSEKARLEGITAQNSGKSLGEVAAAFTMLKEVSHKLAVKETGTGLYKGNKSTDSTTSVIATDCTEIVYEVLSDTFEQQKQSNVWTQIRSLTREYTKISRRGKLSGIDLQAALQKKLGWAGVFWAPDPLYPKYSWKSLPKNDQEVAYYVAKREKTYLKAFGGAKDYPGLSIDKLVVNYAPEKDSTTLKDDKDLNRLRKVPFGVFSAHGGAHMCLIVSGIVYEVHWDHPSTSERVIEGRPLEIWGGFGRWGAGAIVAPRADVNKAWKV